MSRLNELLRHVKAEDAGLGEELEREVRALSSRRAFGLNFERHRPEAVELPNRPVRRGDKVRIQPERGTTKSGDSWLWLVQRIQRIDGQRVAHLTHLDADPSSQEPEIRTKLAEDLLVVAEFRDPIYPGLVPTGHVDRAAPDNPAHTVINGENYHVLKALTYTHRGKVDAIYIDPPYNTGAKDWKYNNDYVDAEDIYRHSKWLAFMERRLKLAKQLLDPDDSVLIVTIDEKEYRRLGLLLEQTFPQASIQMVTSVISAKGVVRQGRFSRVEEYIYFVFNGDAQVQPWMTNMLNDEMSLTGERPQIRETPIEWLGLRRREPSSVRGARPNQFYPVFVDPTEGVITGIGEAAGDDVDRHSVAAPSGSVAVWPLRGDGAESLWGLTPDAARRNWQRGYVRVNWNKRRQTGTVYYLPGGTIQRIRDESIIITGRGEDGSVQGHALAEEATTPPKQLWHMRSHNAELGGTNVLTALLPGRRFPFPKSVYAVEDVLRLFVGDKPKAVVLDFFAGSGTTAHAVMRLNRQDGGRRQCISVTNNEVAADEHNKLLRKGLRPGDVEWEALGICDYVTKPRIEAAITGRTPEGEPIKGTYRFTDEFPMAEGFEENAEFFTLTYEAPIPVGHNRAFFRIASLLWLRAGAQGPRIDTIPAAGWAATDTYGILFDLDQAGPFAAATAAAAKVRLAYVVTDDERRFQAVTQRLPHHVEPVRLYESYLSNFRFVNGD